MPVIKRPSRYAALAGGYYDDPAIIAAGPDAELLYIRMISWCAMHPETDGVIPSEVALHRLGFNDAFNSLNALEDNDLITVNENTVVIISWTKWNGSWSDIKASDDARKASARERKARQRARKASAQHRDTETASPAATAPSESIPAPADSDEPATTPLEATVIEPEPGPAVEAVEADTAKINDRPDIDAICDHMAESVAARTGRRPRITKRWRDAARLMIDRDQRSVEQIHAAIEWVAQSDFWAANILGIPKLRDKWDTIYLQASRAKQPRLTRAEEFRNRQRAEAEKLDALWAAQAAQAAQTEILAIEGCIQ
jgi:hypothetical protein